MNFFKSRARFLLPIALLAGTYAASALHPEIATEKPQLAAPAPKTEPIIAPTTETPTSIAPIAEPAQVTVISNPPGKPAIVLTVRVRDEKPVTTPTTTQPTEPSEQPVTPPAEPEPQKPSPEPSVLDNIITTITDIIPL
jgi:hypothetical protein